MEKKAEILERGAMKKSTIMKNLTNKKETKQEILRRLENERNDIGRNKMRSGLLRQKREKDGKLVRLWQHNEKPALRKPALRKKMLGWKN